MDVQLHHLFYLVGYYDVEVTGSSNWLTGRYETYGEVSGHVW